MEFLSVNTQKCPRFSVAIPTRNRSQWVGGAIRSALHQTFTDIEVVVVDNSTHGDNSTQLEVEKLGDQRLRYIRTGGLGMAENWQIAVTEARGEFLSVCSDKLVMQPWILQVSDDLLRKYADDAIVWQIGEESAIQAFSPESLSHQKVNGRHIFDAAASGAWRLLFNAGPRGMNSVFKRSFVEETKNQLKVSLCRMICPDYNIALSLAALNADVRVLNHVGTAFVSNAHGNAMLCIMNSDKNAIRSQFEVPELEPLPTRYLTAVNHIYYDIVKTNQLLPPSERRSINWEMYFLNLVHEAVDASEFQKSDDHRRAELIKSIRAQSIKLRCSLLRTIICQEFANLISGRRRLRFQIWRMFELIKYPLKGLI